MREIVFKKNYFDGFFRRRKKISKNKRSLGSEIQKVFGCGREPFRCFLASKKASSFTNSGYRPLPWSGIYPRSLRGWKLLLQNCTLNVGERQGIPRYFCDALSFFPVLFSANVFSLRLLVYQRPPLFTGWREFLTALS